MKRLIITAVGLALVVGIIIGGMVGNPWTSIAQAKRPTSTPTPVTPTATPATREAVIPFAGGGDGPSAVCASWCVLSSYLQVRIDASYYPQGTTFRLEALVQGYNPEGITDPFCVRLADVTDEFMGVPVSGSEVCMPGVTGRATLISGAFTLPAGEHLYSLQLTSNPIGQVRLGNASVRARWLE